MDKYEYRMKTEQMLALIEAKAYAQAMEIADTIDWGRVKNIIMLCATSEVYEMNGNLEKSREILFIAYDRAPDNKKIIYRLGILALKQGDISEAMDCYDEFLVIAPKDPNQYILKYKIQKIQNASVLLQIETLKSFKAVEYVEKWAYELANLYNEAGMIKECMAECDDLSLWFSESDYVKKALEMKIKHDQLTPAQEVIYKQLNPSIAYDSPVSETVFKDEIVLEEPVNIVTPIDDMGATKVINAEELQQINDAMKQELMQTVAIDSKAVLEAEEKAKRDVKVAPPIVVRGTPIVPSIPIETVAAGLAAATVVSEAAAPAVPLKSRTTEVSPETTGQLRIDEIFAGWQNKQKEMEEAIAEKKAENEEKLAREAKEREEEKRKKEEEIQADAIQEVPDEVKRILQDMEGGVEKVAPEVAEEEITPQEENLTNKGEALNDDIYIEEEFYDNTFDADEEYEELTAGDESPVQTELDDIEALLQAGDAEEVKVEQEIEDSQTDENPESVEEYSQQEEQLEEPSRMERAKAVATGRTSKLPTEDIVKALGGVSQDTGYIIQGKYDLEAQSQIGLRAGLTEEQKKLFSYFVPVRGMSEQLVDVLDRDKKCVDRNGTSATGNLLIVGRKGSGKTVLAVDVVKAIQKNRPGSSGKVAIVTGEALNKKKISDIVGKLYGGALIIEKASQMSEKTITRLNKAMERETGEILIVLEDERRPLDSLLATNLEFRRRFTSRLEVPVFINDELVTFGQAYAKENGFRIDEMGILALYSKIDREQRDDYAVSVADVKDILDDAMDEAQKGGVRKIAKKIFGKNEDAENGVILSEKHFGL